MPVMDDLIDRVRHALSERYEVVREIGAGGMARVYLARDSKHDRDVALKVLDPHVSLHLGAERFLREISIAAGFTHPHIVPVHDSGEAEGLLYFVMPYLEGESLKDRLDREGHLPVEDAARIGREVAEALAYAHARGVIHRDVKPANVLLSSGQAVLADLGIARAVEVVNDERLTRTGVVAGTPLYMSPEQLEGSAEVDARSDIYALGCIVYEMLTGRPPHEGKTVAALMVGKSGDAVRPIHELRAGVPHEVDDAVLKALASVPADRYVTADEFARALSAPGTSGFRRPRSRRALTGRNLVVPAVAAPVLLLVAFLLTRSEGLAFGERDWIVIADLDNRTGESVFDQSLNTALTTAVSQSQYVNVYPRPRVEEALRRMGRDSVSAFDEALAREVAIRENLKAAIAFEIGNVGETYVLSTRVLSPESGAAVYSENVQADGRAEVLNAVDELARRLRSNLGESLAEISERSVPLVQATTRSLDALKRHTDGTVAWRGGRWAEARTLWSDAVAQDSAFAWAHASLGLATDWLDGPGSGQPHFDRALALLDRVSERERLWIRSLIQDGEAMVETLSVFTQLYPDDRDAWYNLGNGLRALARYEEALAAYDRSLQVDSLAWWAHNNRAFTLDRLGRYDEAAAAFDVTFRLSPEARIQVGGDVNRTAGFVLAKVGDTAAAREHFELLLTRPPDERANGLRSLALLDVYRGRMAKATEYLLEAIDLNRSTDSWLSEYRNRLYLAHVLELRGMPAEATAERDAAEEMIREYGADTYWWMILLKQSVRSGELDRADRVLAAMRTRSGPRPSETHAGLLAQADGEVSLAGGSVDSALSSLLRARATVRELSTLESLAHGYATAERTDAAITAYEELLTPRSLGDENQLYWLAAHVRMGRLYEAAGRGADAAHWYDRLLELWLDGDPGLPLIIEARSRLGV